MNKATGLVKTEYRKTVNELFKISFDMIREQKNPSQTREAKILL